MTGRPRELGATQHLDGGDELVEVDVQHPGGATCTHPVIVPGGCDDAAPSALRGPVASGTPGRSLADRLTSAEGVGGRALGGHLAVGDLGGVLSIGLGIGLGIGVVHLGEQGRRRRPVPEPPA